LKARSGAKYTTEQPINHKLDVDKTLAENGITDGCTLRWWLQSMAPSEDWLKNKPIVVPDIHAPK
jgi:hypothetical protein